jgi:hypothetical protein
MGIETPIPSGAKAHAGRNPVSLPQHLEEDWLTADFIPACPESYPRYPQAPFLQVRDSRDTA